MRDILIIFLVLVSYCSFGQKDDETEYALRILNAIESRDFDNFKLLLPTEKQLEYLANLTGKPIPDNFFSSFINEKKQEFERLLHFGDRHNVQWTKYRIDKFDFDKKNSKKSEVELIQGMLTLKNRKRQVTVDELFLVKLDSSFYLVGIRNIFNGKIYYGTKD